jgi:hypothetical protein
MNSILLEGLFKIPYNPGDEPILEMLALLMAILLGMGVLLLSYFFCANYLIRLHLTG